MYIDSHTHLDHCRPPAEELLEQARETGVDLVIQSGTDPEASEWAVSLAKAHRDVFATCGFHPHDADTFTDKGWDVIERLVEEPEVVGVGEAGLDFYRDYSPRSRQREVFRRHVALACERGLPLVVHTRAAEEETFAALADEAEELSVILHCFSAPERLPEVIERGYFVSFAGNVTFKKAEALRKAAREVPLERIMVETDAPYLAPEPKRGRPNSPAMVVRTYELLAAERQMDVADLAQAVRENVRRAFPRLAAVGGDRM